MASAEIGALRVNLAMNAAEFEKGAEDAGDSLSELAKRFGVTATSAKVAAVAIAAAFVVAAKQIADGVKIAIDRSAELVDVAERFKVPVESLNAFATEGGVAVDKMSEGFTRLTENMRTIASGDVTSAAARSFAAVGVSALDASGNLKSITDVLGELADKFKDYEEGVGKTTLATNIFGSAGSALLPILNEGSDGMDELADKARNAGMQLDEGLAAAAKRVKDGFAAMVPSFDNFYNRLAIAVLPTLDRAVKEFTALTESMRITEGMVRLVADAFKVLVSTGVIVKGVLKSIGDAAVNAGSVLKNVIEGEYTKALEVYRSGNEEAQKNVSDTIRGVQEVWGGWMTNMEETAATHKDKVAAPLIASVTSITEAQREWNKEVAAGVALANKSLTPMELQVKQMGQLQAAYEEGKISAELLARAQFQATMVAQNAYAGMASNIAGSLEKVFSQSKAVAIASALINTYESVTKALATYPPPFNYVAAAASLAAGLVQVANIRKTSKGSSGGGGGGGGGGQGAVASGPGMGPQQLLVQGLSPDSLLTGASVKDLANKLLEFQRDGGQVVLQ